MKEGAEGLDELPNGPFVIHGEAPGILHHIWVDGAEACPICGAKNDEGTPEGP
jgi:hypothetical protein